MSHEQHIRGPYLLCRQPSEGVHLVAEHSTDPDIHRGVKSLFNYYLFLILLFILHYVLFLFIIYALFIVY